MNPWLVAAAALIALGLLVAVVVLTYKMLKRIDQMVCISEQIAINTSRLTNNVETGCAEVGAVISYIESIFHPHHPHSGTFPHSATFLPSIVPAPSIAPPKLPISEPTPLAAAEASPVDALVAARASPVNALLKH
jgi:hypothetical protein